MEAKEFMLNDIVYRKEHFEFHKPVPRSVVKIDGVNDNDMITIAPDSEFLDMDEIEPIPLTAEILEKNGFVRQEEERGFSEPYILYINDDYGYPIKIYPKFYLNLLLVLNFMELIVKNLIPILKESFFPR